LFSLIENNIEESPFSQNNSKSQSILQLQEILHEKESGKTLSLTKQMKLNTYNRWTLSPKSAILRVPNKSGSKSTQQHNLSLLEWIMAEFARSWCEESLQGIFVPYWRLFCLGR
jgi:hypothetical protein